MHNVSTDFNCARQQHSKFTVLLPARHSFIIYQQTSSTTLQTRHTIHAALLVSRHYVNLTPASSSVFTPILITHLRAMPAAHPAFLSTSISSYCVELQSCIDPLPQQWRWTKTNEWAGLESWGASMPSIVWRLKFFKITTGDASFCLLVNKYMLSC